MGDEDSPNNSLERGNSRSRLSKHDSLNQQMNSNMTPNPSLGSISTPPPSSPPNTNNNNNNNNNNSNLNISSDSSNGGADKKQKEGDTKRKGNIIAVGDIELSPQDLQASVDPLTIPKKKKKKKKWKTLLGGEKPMREAKTRQIFLNNPERNNTFGYPIQSSFIPLFNIQ